MLLTDRQRVLLAHVLSGTNVPNVVDRIAGERLSYDEIERVINALSQEFHTAGIDENYEATAYGVELEELLDIVNRPRLRVGSEPSDHEDTEQSPTVTEERRDGWVAECPNGHRFRATVLKSWGARWIAAYDAEAKFVLICDYDAARGGNVAAYIAEPEVAAWMGQAVDLSRALLSTTARCPICRVALPFEDGTLPSDVLWIESQLLFDGKTRRVSKLREVAVVGSGQGASKQIPSQPEPR